MNTDSWTFGWLNSGLSDFTANEVERSRPRTGGAPLSSVFIRVHLWLDAWARLRQVGLVAVSLSTSGSNRLISGIFADREGLLMRLIQRQVRAALAGSLLVAGVSSAQAPCAGLVGDCDENGTVTIGELVLAVNIALGRVDLANCRAADAQGDERVSITELILAIGDALRGCDCPDCDDGNPCTRDVCFDDRCAHGPITCPDDGNECTAERCEPETGCGSHPEDGIPCGAGNGECDSGDCIPLTATPTPTPGVDLVPASARSHVPPSGVGCLSSDDQLSDPVNLFCVENRGTASSGGFDVVIAGERGSERVRAESLQAASRACFSVPSVGGSLEVTADAAEEVDEIDEDNNIARFEAPTPIVTRPPACTPTVVP